MNMRMLRINSPLFVGVGIIAALIIIAVIISLFSSGKETVLNLEDKAPVELITLPVGNTPFDTALTMRENEVLRFRDGLSVGLAKIEDSRCKEGAQCIWAGELKGIFQVIEPNSTVYEMAISTITKTAAVIGDYTFTYKDATEHTITFIVSKKGETIDTKNKGDSGIKGSVQLDGRPFATDVFIFQRDDLVAPYKKVQSSAGGEYSAALPAGVYRVRAQAGAVFPYCLEQEATVIEDEYATADIACSSGIR